MVASAIRQLATASNSPIVASGLLKGTLQLWDLQTGEQCSTLETILDFGGRRLALSPSGKFVVTASWAKGKRGGVACYSTESGQVVWHRTDIGHVQRLRVSRSGDVIWCGLNEGPLQCLKGSTGATLKTRRGLLDIIESPHSMHHLFEHRNDELVIAAETQIRVRRLTFGLLDAAFGPDALCLSEATGPVRCVDLSTGEGRWRYEPGAGRHVLRLAHRAQDGNYYGVEWDYRRGKSRHLVRLNAHTGRCEELCRLTSWEEDFCTLADRLVTSNGEVIDFENGSITNRLAFPVTGYPRV